MMYKWLDGKRWCIGTRINTLFAPPNNGSGVPEWFMQHWHTGEREWVSVNRIREYRLTPEGDSLEEKGPEEPQHPVSERLKCLADDLNRRRISVEKAIIAIRAMAYEYDVQEATYDKLQGLLRRGFMTCVSPGEGNPFVKVSFESLVQAQELHRTLFNLCNGRKP